MPRLKKENIKDIMYQSNELIMYNIDTDTLSKLYKLDPSEIDKYIVYITTSHVNVLRSIIEVLKEAIREAPIYFKMGTSIENNLIRIINEDKNSTLCVITELKADKGFTNFHIKYPEYTIGIDLERLFAFFKMIKNGILNMFIEENDESILKFNITNDEKICQKKFSLKLQDIDNLRTIVPKAIYDMSVKIDCAEFHKTMREVSQLSDFINIICTPSKLTFKIVGDLDSMCITYKNCVALGNSKIIGSTKGVTIKVSENCPNPENVKIDCIFELQKLLTFNKCSNMCPEVQLYLKNNYPMFLRYKIATLGEMKVILTPKIE